MNVGDPQQPDINQPTESQTQKLNRLLSMVNIAEDIDEEELTKIGQEVHKGYLLDRDSKKKWDSQVDEWIKLATQVKEEKTWPWPKAANIKYPLLSTAALQFQARAYPSLIPADGKVVQFKVLGADADGQETEKANRLAKHMNYQLMIDMEDWEEEMDRLLLQLPIIGCLFKKTYFDEITKKNVSRLLGPKNLIVNYWAPSLEGAPRKTEVIEMDPNKLKAFQNAKIYREVELPDTRNEERLVKIIDVHENIKPATRDITTPYNVLEQHTSWDLDEDGYAEPYIITIEESSKKVLRMVARWDSDGIISNKDGDLICINPVEYYTKYGFIPNPDGGFYDIGFGHLLGSLNESANTILNQLVDAGTLSNLQAGFIGKGLRLKMGDSGFQPGEWKAVNATGDDIKKQIFPLPTREPSEVLFKLLGLVIESSNKLASIAEIFVGKMPGQNTPATTTMATIEQGMKVFTAIYKRVYRSLSKEFKHIFRLNGLHPENTAKASTILQVRITQQDYDLTRYDVCPQADPTAVSSTQKLLKAQGLMELLQLGTLNVMEVTKRVLDAQEQPNIQGLLLQQQQQQPDPKMMQIQAQMQADKETHQMEMQKMAAEMKNDQIKMFMEQQQQANEMKMDQLMQQMELKFKTMEAAMTQYHEAKTHSQEMASQKEAHQMKVSHEKEMNNVRRQGAMARMEKPSSHGSTK